MSEPIDWDERFAAGDDARKRKREEFHSYWILEGQTPKPVDLMTWANWFEKSEQRHVADSRKGDVRVSTVFLGLDHRFDRDGPPILFETMIFGGEYDQWQERCETWDQALAMHRKACELSGVL